MTPPYHHLSCAIFPLVAGSGWREGRVVVLVLPCSRIWFFRYKVFVSAVMQSLVARLVMPTLIISMSPMVSTPALPHFFRVEARAQCPLHIKLLGLRCLCMMEC